MSMKLVDWLALGFAILQCHIVLFDFNTINIDGLVQNCSISIANALEILQSCTKPLKYYFLSICMPPGSLLLTWFEFNPSIDK